MIKSSDRNSAAARSEGGNQVASFDVRGMDCPSCAESISASVRTLGGIVDVDVDVVRGRVRVEHHTGAVERSDLAAAVRNAGFEVVDNGRQAIAYRVVDMCCAEEVRQIRDKLDDVEGIESLQFDLVRRHMLVEGSASAGAVKRAVAELGMTAHAAEDEPTAESFWSRRGRLVATVLSGALLVVGVALDWLIDGSLVSNTVLALATFIAAWYVAPRAWRSLRNKTLDMHFLMLAAAIGAAGIGQWAEGAAVLFLFSLAQLLESWSMQRSRREIEALLEVAPAKATVKRNGGEATVLPEEVEVGESIIIRPGDKVPLDGEVVSGDSSVNEAPITGESMPVEKSPGDGVFAGSINEHGALEVRVTRHAEDSTLARIIHAVEEAQASRAPTQSFVERFARVYTPVVVATAVAVFIGPPLLGLGEWSEWFYRALAMLVIACPCALVISTPVSIVSGLAGAAHNGILIKGGLYLEDLSSVNAVAFDKTGTLTEGKPAVTDVLSLVDEEGESHILQLAAGLEQGSEHALARAIVAEAQRRNLSISATERFKAFPGRGVRGQVEGRRLLLGNERFCREQGCWSQAVAESLRRLEQEGKTAVVLFDEHQPLGIIGVADQIRPETASAIAALRGLGLQLVMLTGDNRETAQSIAREISIEEHRAELLPEQKVESINEYTDRGQRVAYVGDGINDAPALAASTVGLAMGAAGTDVAIETADVALMGDDLSKVAYAVRLSRKTSRVVKQNIAFSIAVKVVVAVLALAGWATLWMAVVADMGSSLAVTFNGLRCRWLRTK